ncbi:MAG: 30S ribosomal protein S4 [Elusimicrobiota bacterium]
MAVYRGAVCKLCRREKKKLYLKGQRCLTAKCSYEKRQYPPGQHGQRRGKITEYGIQLREKQELKRTVFMTEKQFRIFFRKAEKEEGPTGENLLIKLECRIDNVVRRLGLASSIMQARQMVLHKMIKVNGKICNVSSSVVKEGDTISVAEKYKKIEVIKKSLEDAESTGLPEWLNLDTAILQGTVLRKPTRDEISLVGGDVKENLIVELYSK